MDVIFENSWQLLDGLAVTIQVTLGAAVVALLMAFTAGLGRLSRFRTVRVLSVCYIEFFRGTSALVQLFWLFFVLPFFGVTLSPMIAGIGGLGLCVGAYGAEVVRAGILAVPKAQIESAAALNLSSAQMIWHVVMPQAVRIMLPSFGNLFIELLKISSLVSLITLQDLTFQAASINAVTLRVVPIFTSVLVLYFILSMIINGFMRLLERRFNVGIEPGIAR
ncbi:polar amino acid transport system permease protein [Rhodoligotrophos appendicifer]|uniref:ectoine/hydroxyectoine ABC transporter permease subunit EhuC n=1 Tax=Rhodoligotrophos appendicifer TaxID=987056 RepID=UPI00117D450E|nr:ectoine/hydroxyectoine ABC transporter permease subunit EhuC [Rhodoligotrophos appendicifer]